MVEFDLDEYLTSIHERLQHEGVEEETIRSLLPIITTVLISDTDGHMVGAVELFINNFLASQRQFQKKALFLHDDLFMTLSSGVHDIVTPLAIILAMINSIKRKMRGVEASDERVSEYFNDVDIITEQVLYIKAIMAHLSEMYKLKIVPLDKKEVSLVSVVAEICHQVEALAIEKKLEFDVKIEETHIKLQGDRMSLCRMLINLITNAIHYTDQGRIEVRVFSSPKWAVIEISDTGPGISAEDKKHVFKPFFRASGNNGKSGTGLGLAVAAKIVAEHQGNIEVESEIGQGTTFKVFLPLE